MGSHLDATDNFLFRDLHIRDLVVIAPKSSLLAIIIGICWWTYKRRNRKGDNF